ncbi:MAG: tyrosine-type recombinase/integrase [Candidatus Methanoperedenaceae archaeon]|nr:tyrosine-type recombinase/integrase [Candidatus Methanoperedenaceae archaeon]
MTSADDIHEFDKQYNRALNKLKSGVNSEINRELLQDYVRFCRKKGNKKSTITADLMVAIRFVNLVDNDLDKLEERDLDKLIDYLEAENKDDFSYRKFAKKFFGWLTNGDLPKWIRELKVPHKDTPVQPSDLLTKSEMDALLNACMEPRDKALVATLLDSGMRIGALGTLRIKNIQHNNMGAVLYMSVTGKNQKTTAPKPVPITWSTGYLNAWLDVHPLKHDPEAPLWVSTYGKYIGNPMSYNTLVQRLRQIKKRSGVKKRIHFHLFRHQKVTTMILEKFSDQQIKFQAGWTQDSNRMMKVYGNFQDGDMVKSIYANYGLSDMGGKQVTLERCPRCHIVLVPDARVCHQCALILDSTLSKDVQEMEAGIPDALAVFMNDPEVLRKFQEALTKTQA